uniref:Protein Wnt n=1 Tax=Romanomermis culicivorax TaxID=13658 RepID=A0A915J511_ROMCU
CDDNIDFGCRKSSAFLLVSKRNVRDTEAQISRHNYHVGCQAVKVLVTKKCKCHGLSGSCEISTCYKKVAQFRASGDLLSIDTDRRILMPHIVGDTVPNLKDVGNLVYTEQSPNFCVPNRSLGILSPVGRQCLTTGTAESWGSCQKLCCGKRVVAVETSVVESCNCTFEYCCKVRCERCTWKIFTHHCSNLDA